VFFLGSRFLTALTNLLFAVRLRDQPTGCKAFRTSTIKSIRLDASGFDFCSEITGKLCRLRVNIVEVPVSYAPRTRRDGKKIRWRDGVYAAWTLLKVRLAPRHSLLASGCASPRAVEPSQLGEIGGVSR
jgi:hypothetical protein